MGSATLHRNVFQGTLWTGFRPLVSGGSWACVSEVPGGGRGTTRAWGSLRFLGVLT